MNQASQNRLKKVHPELAKRVRELIEGLATQGHTIEVVQGLRTFGEQDELYKQAAPNQARLLLTQKAGSPITITVWQSISARSLVANRSGTTIKLLFSSAPRQ